jgi:hypothetical protein
MPRRADLWKRCVATIVVVALAAPPAYASKTAGVIAAVSAMNGAKWGFIAAVDPEPASKTVCAAVGCVYGFISGAAWLYDVIADPVVVGVPTVQAVYAGPAVWRDPDSGELLPPEGSPVSRAPAWRVVSIVGRNFSWTPGQISVKFGDLAAPVLPLSTNTLLMAAVPLAAGGGPTATQIRVTVNGKTGLPYPFTIDPQPPLADDPDATVARLDAKEHQWLNLIASADWAQLLDQEAPDLPADDRQAALQAAQDMVDSAVQILGWLPQVAGALQIDVVAEAYAHFVELNPEFETLLDDSIADLTGQGVVPLAKHERPINPRIAAAGEACAEPQIPD